MGKEKGQRLYVRVCVGAQRQVEAQGFDRRVTCGHLRDLHVDLKHKTRESEGMVVYQNKEKGKGIRNRLTSG